MKIIRVCQDNGEDKNDLNLKSIDDVKRLIPDILSVSQREYDKWDEDDRDTYAGGGICHLIADAMSNVLWKNDVECTTISSNFEQHVYCMVRVIEGVYSVDIHHSTYEVGGGFSWKKLPDIVFENDDVQFYKIDGDPNSWENYLDNY